MYAPWGGLVEFEGRRCFLSPAVDRARRSGAQKRGGDLVRTTLNNMGIDGNEVDVLDLERALTELSTVDPRGAEIVQLRVFGGMSVPEVAEQLGVGTATVDRSWRRSRAFLAGRLRS